MSEQSPTYAKAPVGGLPPTEIHVVGDPRLGLDAWTYIDRIELDAEGNRSPQLQQYIAQGQATAPVRYVLGDMLTNAVADANKWHERYQEAQAQLAAAEAREAALLVRTDRVEANVAGLKQELAEQEREKLELVKENEMLCKLLQAGKEYMELTRRTQDTPFHDSALAAEPWRAVFATEAEYDASVASVTARIQSGEVQPRQPDWDEDASEPPQVAPVAPVAGVGGGGEA
jgi:hypothetical protein